LIANKLNELSVKQLVTGWITRIQFPARIQILLFAITLKPALGPPILLSTVTFVLGVIDLRMKCLKCKAGESPPSNAKI
jgi:hypothetical protein